MYNIVRKNIYNLFVRALETGRKASLWRGFYDFVYIPTMYVILLFFFFTR